jgi:hypothetical protein
MSTKNSNETIGNRTRDLPVCSAVPQQTAPPRAPFAKVAPKFFPTAKVHNLGSFSEYKQLPAATVRS